MPLGVEICDDRADLERPFLKGFNFVETDLGHGLGLVKRAERTRHPDGDQGDIARLCSLAKKERRTGRGEKADDHSDVMCALASCKKGGLDYHRIMQPSR